MNHFVHVKYLCFVLLFSTFIFAINTQAMEIITPSQKHISEENIVSFVIQANSADVNLLILTTDKNETFNINVDPSLSHYCQKIKLHLGENNISISGFKNNTLVKQEKREIFLTSKVHKEYRYPPEQYSKNYFHNDVNEKICSTCHDMSVNEIKGVAFKDITNSNCYQCHSALTAKKHSHAPAVNWLCTSCHNGEVGKFNKKDNEKTKYSVPDPIGPVCYSCHKSNKNKFDKKHLKHLLAESGRFKHEPADSGRCNKCHNSHSEENEFYLRKPVWELCTGCHKDKIEGVHIIKTFGRKRHPTHNKKDPSRPGKDLSCISCHNPHASNTSSLLQSNSVFGLCGRCHKK
jgi:predicted CXXCH cytochrome family protein